VFRAVNCTSVSLDLLLHVTGCSGPVGICRHLIPFDLVSRVLHAVGNLEPVFEFARVTANMRAVEAILGRAATAGPSRGIRGHRCDNVLAQHVVRVFVGPRDSRDHINVPGTLRGRAGVRKFVLLSRGITLSQACAED